MSESQQHNRDDAQREFDRQKIRERLREEAQKLKVRETQGEYQFDNPDLEHKTKRQTKLGVLEEKYKDKPKIAFHKLSDEGNKLFMQAKRDKVWTTIGWSLIGNIAGIILVQYIDSKSDKQKTMRYFQRHEFMKAGAFITSVGLFTLYGYGNARQAFIKRKLQIVELHSESSSDQ